MSAASLPPDGGASTVTADSPPLKRASLRPLASDNVLSLSKTTRPRCPQLGAGSGGLAWVSVGQLAASAVRSSADPKAGMRCLMSQSYPHKFLESSLLCCRYPTRLTL